MKKPRGASPAGLGKLGDLSFDLATSASHETEATKSKETE